MSDAQSTTTRRKDLQAERNDTYGRMFKALINEQDAVAGC